MAAMEPPFYFVRDKGSRVAHHWDYDRDRKTRALCGHQYEDEIVFEGTKRPNSVCRECSEVLPRFESRWWRETAQKSFDQCARLQERCANAEQDAKISRVQIEKLTYKLGLAEGRIEGLKAKVANQRKNLNDLQSARAAAKRAVRNIPDRAGPAKTMSAALPLIRRQTVQAKPK
jgi:hypothetical protein